MRSSAVRPWMSLISRSALWFNSQITACVRWWFRIRKNVVDPMPETIANMHPNITINRWRNHPQMVSYWQIPTLLMCTDVYWSNHPRQKIALTSTARENSPRLTLGLSERTAQWSGVKPSKVSCGRITMSWGRLFLEQNVTLLGSPKVWHVTCTPKAPVPRRGAVMKPGIAMDHRMAVNYKVSWGIPWP